MSLKAWQNSITKAGNFGLHHAGISLLAWLCLSYQVGKACVTLNPACVAPHLSLPFSLAIYLQSDIFNQAERLTRVTHTLNKLT